MQIVLSCNEYLNNFYVNEKDQITHVGNGLWISYEFLVLFSINSERKFQMNFKSIFLIIYMVNPTIKKNMNILIS